MPFAVFCGRHFFIALSVLPDLIRDFFFLCGTQEADDAGYLGLEDMGIITNHDKDCLAAVRQMAASL